jgi:hypothetical protein
MKFYSLLLLTFLSFASMAQTVVEGVKIPNTLKAGETTLHLNGAGVREKYFMDMYVCGLYLKTKSSDADKIMKADEAMGLRLHIVSGLISSDKMKTAIDEGFKNSTAGNTAALMAKINQFKAVFKEEIKEGDIFDLIYESGKGLVIYKNGKVSTTIAGLDFKTALFGIWLCNKPADSALKIALLGKA